MVTAIIMGRKGSEGFPGKNLYKVCGKPMAQWVMEAALGAKCDEVYLTTDCPDLKRIADSLDVGVIERPPELCTSQALGEDVYKHAYKLHPYSDYYVLMMCNAPTVLPNHITDGVFAVNERHWDSACTVSKYNMYHPCRARDISSGNVENIHGKLNVTCDRDSAGDAWFYDLGCAVAKNDGMKNMDWGMPPQRWLKGEIFPILNEAGLDVDYEWQMGQVEWWLRKYRLAQ